MYPYRVTLYFEGTRQKKWHAYNIFDIPPSKMLKTWMGLYAEKWLLKPKTIQYRFFQKNLITIIVVSVVLQSEMVKRRWFLIGI